MCCARVAGMLSGALLQAYCPDAHACDRVTGMATGELGPCDGRKLWGIIGALTCTSPLLILLLQARLHPSPLSKFDGVSKQRGAGSGECEVAHVSCLLLTGKEWL